MSIFTGNFHYVTQTDGSVIQISLTYFIGLFSIHVILSVGF